MSVSFRKVYATFDHGDIVRVVNPITDAVRETYVFEDFWDRIIDGNGRFVHKSNIVEA